MFNTLVMLVYLTAHKKAKIDGLDCVYTITMLSFEANMQLA